MISLSKTRNSCAGLAALWSDVRRHCPYCLNAPPPRGDRSPQAKAAPGRHTPRSCHSLRLLRTTELADCVCRIMRVMNLIHTLSIAMGASWVSGISLYATVAMLGLLSRFAHLELPGELQVLSNWWVIGIAVTLYVVEFIADKIPVVDSAWDVVHTFIRIPAGAVLAATAFGDFDKPVQVIAFLLGGGLALSSHGTKAATRAIVNTSPEPVSNVVVSLTEDVIAIVSIVLAAFLPFLLFAVVAAGLIFTAIILPKIFRFFRQVFRSVRNFFSPAPA